MKKEPVTFKDVVCIRETDSAILCRFPEHPAPIWIPKSQVDDNSEVYTVDESSGDLIITEWIATQRGLV